MPASAPTGLTVRWMSDKGEVIMPDRTHPIVRISLLMLTFILLLTACSSKPPATVGIKTTTPLPLSEPIAAPQATPTEPPQPAPSPTPQSGVAGWIFDQASEQAVVGATVAVDDRQTTTDADGYYALTGLPPGQYVLSVTQPDYDPGLSRIFTLIEGQNLSLDLVLYPSKTSPYPADPMLTNPLDSNGAPTAEEAERLARLQGFSGELVSIRETKLSGEFLVNYKLGNEIRAAVAKVRHEVWELFDETGQKWWIIKVCGNLARRLPKGATILTPEPRPLPPMAEVEVDGLPVRSCPSEACAEVATIERGAQVEISGCLIDGSWCRAGLSDGQSGWCAGSSLRQLAVAEAVPVVAVSGGKIAFLSDRDREPGLPDIYLINPDGSGLTRVTTDLKMASAMANSLLDLEDRFNWSAVQRKFFYANNSGELYSVNADGSGETLVAEGVGRFDPSPDGQTIVFEVLPAFTSSEIAIMNTDGTGKTILTDKNTRQILGVASDSISLSPIWSPAGSQIAFYLQGSLALMNPDGSAPVSLTPPFTVMEPFIWSPDGHSLI
jgi:hypothetical protein